MQVRSLGWEGPLEECVATCSNVLAWKIPWTEEPSRLQSIGSHKSDMTEDLAHTQYTVKIMDFSSVNLILRTHITDI